MNHALKPVCLFIAISLGLGAGAQVSSRAQDQKQNQPPAAAKNEPVVELPVLKIVGNRVLPEPERWWNYSRYENFEVLSELGRTRTKHFVEYFGQFINVITSILPSTQLRTSIPAKIILCDRMSTFRKYGDPWRARVVTFYDNEQVVFVVNLSVNDLQTYTLPKATANPLDLSALDYVIIPEISGTQKPRAKISVSADAGEGGGEAIISGGPGGTDDPFMNVDTTDVVEYALKGLEREYMKVFFARMTPPPPPWFSAAMEYMIMMIDITKKDVLIGEVPIPYSSGTSDASSPFTDSTTDDTDPTADMTGTDSGVIPDRARGFEWLARGALIPMPQIVEGAPLDPKFDQDLWATQCYAFVHYCLYKRGTKLQPAFFKYLMAASEGPVSEAKFKECFGMSYRDMIWELTNYGSYTDYKEQWFKFKTDPYPENVTVAPATEAQVGRMQGEALLMLGKVAAAQTQFIIPYFRKETDPDLLGSLGLILLETENSARARRLLELSYKGGATRARVCLAVAQTRLEAATDAVEKSNGAQQGLNAEQMTAIIEPLSKALGQRPPAAGTYLVLAEAWLLAEMPPKPEHLKVLLDGCRLFPTNIELLWRAATLLIENRHAEDAKPLVERGLNLADTPQDRDRFKALAEKLKDHRLKAVGFRSAD